MFSFNKSKINLENKTKIKHGSLYLNYIFTWLEQKKGSCCFLLRSLPTSKTRLRFIVPVLKSIYSCMNVIMGAI